MVAVDLSCSAMFPRALGYRLLTHTLVLVLTPQAAVHAKVLGTVSWVCIGQNPRRVLLYERGDLSRPKYL